MRIRVLAASLALAVLAAAAVSSWWYANALADPVFRRLTVAAADWPAGAKPVTVALMSDIHLGNAAMDPARLRRIVGQVNARGPDLVALAGDFVAEHDPAVARQAARDFVAPLAALRAPLGVVATLGNHDQSVPAIIRAGLERAGVTVLDNQAVRRGPLAVAGVGDAFSGHDDIAHTVAAVRGMAGARLVVTHSPDVSPELPPGFGLVLAGHTHCGQVNLPVIGAPKTFWKPGYGCGVVRIGGRVTVVTAGLGTSQLPLRWRAPPDVWLVTIGPPSS
jgi:predicted MPP superfamily phosphohydrolase